MSPLQFTSRKRINVTLRAAAHLGPLAHAPVPRPLGTVDITISRGLFDRALEARERGETLSDTLLRLEVAPTKALADFDPETTESAP